MYIESSEPLRHLCKQAQREGRLAIDLEFIRENTYAPQLALIQVAVSDTCAIVDPLTVQDLSPLLEVLTDTEILKVLHAAGQDIEVLHWHAGIIAVPIFDTQVAASLVGLGEQLSYGRLVDALLGISLTKGESYSDWLRRPLLPSQTKYALDDVRYLLPMQDRLSKRLSDMGRASWAADECRKSSNPALYERDPQTLYRRIRNGRNLASQGLAVLRELAIWRDEEARQRNRPVGRVLSNEVLVDLARRTPQTQDDLQRLRGLPQREFERSAEALLAAVQRGLAVPEADQPQAENREHRLTPAEELIVKFLDTSLKALSQREKLPPSFIGNRGDLETLVRRYRKDRLTTEGSPMLEGWRGELVGKDLLAILEGRLGLHLHPKSGKVTFTARQRQSRT
ncbi:MAG: ribonuclease D [Candidatus Tectomicrobia bacterium]|nr:ribonuclease D [Candidatus Tectomicrobia bacterium]